MAALVADVVLDRLREWDVEVVFAYPGDGIDGLLAAWGHADKIGDAWDHALGAGRPTVLDVRCDPDVPPIPPHATFDQLEDATPRASKGWVKDRRACSCTQAQPPLGGYARLQGRCPFLFVWASELRPPALVPGKRICDHGADWS
ncbi:MAG TPA: hypothetical protein VG184_08750 [Acidimicrobiales bacterium]|jgi:hypothetical protein|nr:hypothetical protein [Acidimicrobiales bacterium]